MSIRFEIVERSMYTIVHFELKTNITSDILKDLKPPKVNGTKGVILSGRGPIWLYCYLIHYYHPTKFIATFDPRVGGAVVVESHVQNYEVGDIVKEDIDEL